MAFHGDNDFLDVFNSAVGLFNDLRNSSNIDRQRERELDASARAGKRAKKLAQIELERERLAAERKNRPASGPLAFLQPTGGGMEPFAVIAGVGLIGAIVFFVMRSRKSRR